MDIKRSSVDYARNKLANANNANSVNNIIAKRITMLLLVKFRMIVFAILV